MVHLIFFIALVTLLLVSGYIKLLLTTAFFILLWTLHNQGYTITWAKKQFQNIKLIYNMAKTFHGPDPNQGFLSLSQQMSTFTLNSGTKSATLSYQYVGTSYNIRIPHDMVKGTSMVQFKVELLHTDG